MENRSEGPPPPATLTTQIGVRTMLMAVVAIGAIWTLLHLLPVLLVIVAALFLASTLNPVVEWLESRHLPRSWGIPLVFLCVLGASVLLGVLTVPSLVEQLTTLAKEEPALRGRVADWLSGSRFTVPFAESLRHVRSDALGKAFAETAFLYSTCALEIVAYSVSAIFLALYVMIDRDRLRAGLFATVPRRHHVGFSRVLLGLETIVGGYIRGQVLTSVLMAAFTWTVLTIAGGRNALALALFAGLADVLPYVGVFLSVVPVVVSVLAKGTATVLVVTAAMLAYEEFESRFLVPRIYGRALRLPSSIVLVALLTGGTLMGIIGALLALPVAAAVRMVIEELRVSLPGAPADNPMVREGDDRAEREYERRAQGLPTGIASEIAVQIAEEQERPSDIAPAAPLGLR